jgi:flagellar basal-body rod modification protein FlgD
MATSSLSWHDIGASAAPARMEAPAPDRFANKETFLKLLVAQIKNQNPLNPSDGMEFLSQLAQFTELEQLLSMRQDIGAIRSTLEEQQKGS